MKFFLAVFTFMYVAYFAGAVAPANSTDDDDDDSAPWTWKTYVKNHLSVWGVKKQKVYEMCDECQAKTECDTSLFARMAVRDFPEDRKLKCFWACLAGKLNVVLASKSPTFLNYDALNDILDPVQVGVATKCLGHYMKGEDNCEEVYTTHKCFMWTMDKVHVCQAEKAAADADDCVTVAVDSASADEDEDSTALPE